MASKQTQYTVSVQVIGDDNLRKLMTQMDGLAAKSKQFNDTSRQLANSTRNVGQAAGNMSNGIQNAAFQLQDIVVQMTGGVDASRALGMQLPQLLGGFGALGAVLGVVVSFLPVVASAMASGAMSTEDMSKASKELSDTWDSLNKRMQDQQDGLKNLREDWGASAEALHQLNEELLRNDTIRASQELNESIKNTITTLQGNFGDSDFMNMLYTIRDADFKGSEQVAAAGKDLSEAIFSIRRATDENAEERLLAFSEAVDSLINEMSAAGMEIPASLLDISDGLINLEGSMTKATATMQQQSAAMQAMSDAVGSLRETLTSDVVEAAIKEGEALARLNLEWQAQTDYVTRAILANQKWEDLVTAGLISVEEYNDKILETALAYKAVDDAATQRDLDKAAREQKRLADEAKRTADALKAQAAAVAKQVDPYAAYSQEMEKLNKLLDAGVLSWEHYSEAVFAAQDSLDKIINKEADEEIKRLADAARELDEAFANNVTGPMTGFFDDIISGAKSGKEAFEDMAVNIVRQLANMAIQMMVVKPLFDAITGGGFGSALFGSAKGNLIAGGQPLTAMSTGGIVGGRTIMGRNLIGESGPEAVLPLTRHGGQLGVKASPVNVNITNNAGAEISVNETEAADGTRTIDMVIEAKMKSAFSSGSMDKMMRANYGVRRRGE